MRVFITGICGTLGTQIMKLHWERGDQVAGCSRNEERAKRWKKFNPYSDLQVCDAMHLRQDVLMQYDRVYHCAAMKHVDVCQQNPAEACKQNIDLTAGVVNNRTVFISSDKACQAANVYGHTKAIAEVIALQAGAAVVRFGNLIGSSGSVLQLWKDANELTLTDPDMTRYFLSVRDAAKFAVNCCLFNSINVLESMDAVRMGDLAAAFDKPVRVTGPRPGETKHQWLIAPGETVNGKLWTHGLCSNEAPRWNAKELLEEMP